MLMSKLLGRRFKEQPSDAFMDSHAFMLRGGYIRQVSNGIFTLLMPAKRVAEKIEKILREEMDVIDGQEVLFPVVLPAELWKESGRFESVGSELVRFKDRAGRDMILGMTHEEAAVHIARIDAQSYTDYPFMIYQIQTKFRDEPRSRGGLIRVREFTMKDAYSFHTSEEDLVEYYDKVHEAYERIYERAGLSNVISVKSDTGMMGGKVAHEFMYLSDKGEDTLVLCPECGYKSNMEIASAQFFVNTKEQSALEEVHTPGVTDIDSLAEFFKTDSSSFIKSTVYAQEGTDRLLVVFIRGDYSVNEAKLKNAVGRNIFPYVSDGTSSLCFGYIGPYKLHAPEADILFDKTLDGEESLICGANKEDYHLKGVSISREINPAKFVDVSKVNDGDLCIHCGAELKLSRGIEVGNIFQLGTKYPVSMDMTYLAADNKQYHPIMASYGIGVGRMFACLIEEHHDEYGPIWPMAVAPWQIHICALNNNQADIAEYSQKLYGELSAKYEVMMDDRGVAAGVMFADADLLGIPIRVIISSRNMKNGEVELCTRDKTVKKTVKLADVLAEIDSLVQELSK